jgi:hypothetical protein
MAAIPTSLHIETADDLFGTPRGSPRADKLIAASIQWSEQIYAMTTFVHGCMRLRTTRLVEKKSRTPH